MEKLFYTLEEAAQRLGKTADEVRTMAARGQLSEFRGRDRLMLKKEQVDLHAGGADDSRRRADSGELEPVGLASSGTAPGIKADKKESTGSGFNLLELDSTDEADANAVTRVTASPTGSLVDPGDDKGKSGSAGLLDLTREADDTSLGAGLLEDVYGSETVASATVADDAGGLGGAAAGGGGSLFESPGAGTGGDFEAAPAAATAMAPVEAYDGPGSGLVGGLAVGAIAALGVAAFTLIAGMNSSTGGGLVATIGENMFIIVGVCARLPIHGAAIGWFRAKKT
ncbi:MAG: helix-turn-helix domain-containing protein [Phycisphaerae bacterium]